MGSFAFGLFVAAMTIGRAAGGFLLDRFGRVTILRASAIFAITGLLIVILSQNYEVARIGIILWGLGAVSFRLLLWQIVIVWNKKQDKRD
ncbi:hypothetical protein [Paenibacillus sp. NPDC057934]|uniref:hypothetical protein n=1 Tax=Paenibacillus sp. NPDC057934 TaxID=3346282 RepID=UPI0036D79AAC